MAEASRHGNQYGPIFNFGGRSHQGNNYNFGPSSDEQTLLSILESLEYPGMHERRDTLTEAESGTFRWALAAKEVEFVTRRIVYDDGETRTHTTTIDKSFTSWLQGEEEELFCFMGKPGSGKSTLMKFLATTDSEIDQALKRWAKGKKTFRGEHFFWMLGSPMQKSRESMLKSLLHSLLRSVMRSDEGGGLGLIKYASGPRWSTSNCRAWNCETLHQMLARLTSYSTAKFFLLVDALDECEPQDRPECIAGDILTISQLPNVKVCISCRPWNTFESRFSSAQIIRMDQLTYSDLELYTETRLVEADPGNDICAGFHNKTVATKKFVNEVVKAAEGVFLWNVLVLGDLCSAIRSGCNLRELEEVLAKFPAGLDDFFQKLIVDRIAKTSRNDVNTAATLKLALEIANSLSRDEYRLNPCPESFLNFWLLRGGHLRLGFSWKDHSGRWYSPEDVQRMVAETRSFLEESCKDLLVLTDRRDTGDVARLEYSGMRWDVRFLHRTVADFLRENHTEASTIKEHSPAHFTHKNLLGDLRKIRCLHLLHEMQAGCATAEHNFTQILGPLSLRTCTQDDIDFMSVCETRMTQRFEEDCGCFGARHFRGNIVRVCASTGSTRYALAVFMSWPHLAVCQMDYLKDVVLGYSESVNSTSGSAASEFLDLCSPIGNTMTTSSYRVPVQQNRVQHKHGLFSYLMPCKVTNSSVKLVDHLLACGRDPNVIPGGVEVKCQNNTWERFLTEACQKVKRCEREGNTPERPGKLNEKLQDYKHRVRDLIALFLWHGANPKCTPCIAEHCSSKEPCKRTSLQAISPYIVPHEEIAMIDKMQVIRSKNFDPHLSQRSQRLRAIRSWVQSERSFVAHAGRGNDRDQSRIEDAWLEQQCQFLGGLTGYFEKRPCDKCLKTEYACRIIWCADCNSRYFLCAKCSDEVRPEISNDRVLMGNIIHEKIPLVKGHTSIAFGYYLIDTKVQLCGVEESISVLKGWYAKNSVEPDSGVD